MQRVDRQLGEYRLVARLASGGQSEVFLAVRSGPHDFFRPVVLKVMPDDFRGDPRLEALFYREATIASKFSHPNVVDVHDAKKVDGEHALVMDFVAGQTVADAAQKAFSSGSEFSLDESLIILSDACRGLDYIHSFEDVDCNTYSVVHCDVSPQNLMITYGGDTRVFDFGISQVLGESDRASRELAGGKFSYMSPEQCRDESLDPRSDIFSLGVILYELVTGTRLFRRDSNAEVKEAVISEPIEPPSQVASHLGERIDELVLRALERDPGDRFQTARDLADRFDEVLAHRGVEPSGVRGVLGDKIAGLFEAERRSVGLMLDEAKRQYSSHVFVSDHGSDPGEPTDRELELVERLEEAADRNRTLKKKASRLTEVGAALTEEVKRLQNRQRWFVVGLCVVSLLALCVAMAAFVTR